MHNKPDPSILHVGAVSIVTGPGLPGAKIDPFNYRNK